MLGRVYNTSTKNTGNDIQSVSYKNCVIWFKPVLLELIDPFISGLVKSEEGNRILQLFKMADRTCLVINATFREGKMPLPLKVVVCPLEIQPCWATSIQAPTFPFQGRVVWNQGFNVCSTNTCCGVFEKLRAVDGWMDGWSSDTAHFPSLELCLLIKDSWNFEKKQHS